MLRFSLRDLQFRALRFVVTALATAIVFSIVLLMAGFSVHYQREVKRTVDAFGAESWVVADGEGGPFTGGFTIDASVADDLVERGAEAAAPLSIIGMTLKVDESDEIAYVVGHLPDRLGAPDVVHGEAVSAKGQVVISEESGLGVEDMVTIAGRELEIVGLTRDLTMLGGQPMLFIHLADAQEVFYGGEPLASSVVVSGDVPELGEAHKAMTPSEVREDAVRTLGTAIAAVQYIVVLLWLAGTILIGAVVYVSVLERLRDFAVMKALGGSTTRMWGGVVTQSVVIAVSAGLIASALALAYLPYFPFAIEIPPAAFAQLAVLAVAAGVIASAGGVRKAVKVDPVLAFAAAGR